MSVNYLEKYPYLSLLEKPLNDQQLEVCCRLDNCVVAAGAGSGKTQVLATRFAWLVMEHDEITAPSVLTLTFTKKAAAEMYERIYNTLCMFASNDQVPERQRKNAQRALDDFANVHIQTLDSYCGSIVRQAANRYGVRPDFSIGTQDSSLPTLALSFTIKNRDRIGIKHFAEAGKLQEFSSDVILKIVQNYTSLATEAGYFSSMLKLRAGIIADAWNEYVIPNKATGKNRIETLLSEFYSAFNEYKETKEYAADKAKNTKTLKWVFEAEEMGLMELSYPELTGERISNNSIPLDELSNIKKQLSPFESPNESTSKKDVYTNLFTAHEKLNKEMEYISSILGFILEYKYLEDMHLLLDEFLQQVNEQKRSSGALSHKDGNELALRILIEQKDIRSQEKAAFSKIMIDEFQDNNGKNRDLLFLLSEKNEESMDLPSDYKNPDAVHDALKSVIKKDKLFFVGDEKQSIYKFRGADVSVFNELKDDLAQLNGNDSSLYMIYNYRSTEELLSSFNQIFGDFRASECEYENAGKTSVFSNGETQSYEASYTLNAIAKKMKDGEEKKPVVLTAENVPVHLSLLFWGQEEKEKHKNHEYLGVEDQLAYSTAKKIFELHETKNVSYSDIAILDKNRDDRKYYIKWMEYFNIPYVLDQQTGIFQDAPVNDIYNFLRLCVYPSDINSFAGYLCSPFSGLSEEAVERIMAAIVVQKKEDSFFAFSNEYDELILKELSDSEEIKEHYLAAKKFFVENQGKILSEPLTETMNLLWYERGYRFETLLNTTVNMFALQYDYIYELAKSADENGKSVAWFIDELAIQKKNEEISFGKKESEIDTKEVSFPSEKPDGVQVLTIHKSKGLQYKYVFLLNAFDEAKMPKTKLFYENEKTGVSIKPKYSADNYFQLKDKELSYAKSIAEFKRLIYVGATRAEQELWVVSNYSLKKDGSHSHSEGEVFPKIFEDYYLDFIAGSNQYSFIPGAPFDVFRIECQSYDILNIHKQQKDISIDEVRQSVIEKLSKDAEKNKIEYESVPVINSNTISPSALEKAGDTAFVLESGTSLKNLYPEIDEVMKAAVKRDFGFNDFGTLCHLYLENAVKDVPFDLVRNQAEKLLKKLSDSQKEKLTACCEKICNDFLVSETGSLLKEIKSNKGFYKTEYCFKMYLQQYLITGSIDLVFEKQDGTFVIVDYKTDHDITPEKYFGQQSCYRKAFSMLKKIPMEKVECMLWYVRYNKLVDITQDANVPLTKELFDEVFRSAPDEFEEDSY